MFRVGRSTGQKVDRRFRGLGEFGGKQEMMANEDRVSSGDDENILNLILVMAAHYGCTTKHSIAHSKWVRCTACELYCDKVVIY